MNSHSVRNLTTLSEYEELLKRINDNERRISVDESDENIDVDLLFTDLRTNELCFFEAKYSDDHDTDRFPGLNQKAIWTYAALQNSLEKSEIEILRPHLLYFTERIRYEPQYIPEEYQFRGVKFFKKYFDYDISDIGELLDKAADKMRPLLSAQYKEIVIDKKYNS